jgi:hypothetical protein
MPYFLVSEVRSSVQIYAYTTGEPCFAECKSLYQVHYFEHSAKRLFAECNTRQNKTLGKETLCRVSGTRQRKTLGKGVYLPSAFLRHSAKYIYFFSFLLSNFFCCDVTLSLTTYANLAHYSNCLLYLVN